MKYAKSKTPRGGPSDKCPDNSVSIITIENDRVPCNPQGRGMQDVQKSRDKLLSCKHYVNVATMNVRTIREIHKQTELAYKCKEFETSILGIVEHKIVHSDEILYKQIEDRTLVTSSATRTTSGSAYGGIGFMLSRSAEQNLSHVKRWNDRILVANFNGNPALTM